MASPAMSPPLLLEFYCAGCHRAGRAGFDLDRPTTAQLMREESPQWREVVNKLRDGAMPPATNPQPSLAERRLLIDWIEQALSGENRAESDTGASQSNADHSAMVCNLLERYGQSSPQSCDNLDHTEQAVMSGEILLAAQVARFLWRGEPDERLLERVWEGGLRANLDDEIRRMLLDPRAEAFVISFADYWLGLRKLSEAPVDQALRGAMQRETELFVGYILREDRSLYEFLDADYSFLNDRLAEHYGIGGVHGEALCRVSVRGSQRGGLLTQGSILTVTSAGNETSPVMRGKWVLDNLLGLPPPPPPRLMNGPAQQRPQIEPGNARQLIEQHRADANCRSCHAAIDPYGIALDNFDSIGAWRTHFNQYPIDAATSLPGGVAFDGPTQLKAYLRTQEDLFLRCLSRKLVSYALGRRLTRRELVAVDQIAECTAEAPTFVRLASMIASNECFAKSAPVAK